MKPANIYKLFIFTLLLIALFGCKEGPLKLSVRYDTLGELKANAPVFFEEIKVGHVEKIVSTEQGNFLVEVSILPEHKGAATENSRFFLAYDPSDSNRMILLIEQNPPGGAVLKNGTVVQGEKKGYFDTFMSQLKKSSEQASMQIQETMQSLAESFSEGSQSLNEQIDNSLDEVDKALKDFSASIDSSINEEELAKLQQAIADFMEQFKLSGEDIQNKLREDILPQLRQNLEDLRNQLKKEGREDDVEKIDDTMDQLLSV